MFSWNSWIFGMFVLFENSATKRIERKANFLFILPNIGIGSVQHHSSCSQKAGGLSLRWFLVLSGAMFLQLLSNTEHLFWRLFLNFRMTKNWMFNRNIWLFLLLPYYHMAHNLGVRHRQWNAVTSLFTLHRENTHNYSDKIWWLHCTMQNMFPLCRLGLPISVNCPSPSLYLSQSLEM